MAAGSIAYFEAPGQRLHTDVPVYLWTPEGNTTDNPLPVLVALDGPEYSAYADLLDSCEVQIDAGKVLPFRVALVEPVWGKRDEWYGASRKHDRVLAKSVIPTIREQAHTIGPVVGLGGSLGAVAMLSCVYRKRQHGTFDRLLLQSGSFWVAGPDDAANKEHCFEYDQITTRVAKIKATRPKRTMPIVLTCGLAEADPSKNLRCNMEMADALQQQGHAVTTDWAEGGHDYQSRGRALKPYIAELMRRS